MNLFSSLLARDNTELAAQLRVEGVRVYEFPFSGKSDVPGIFINVVIRLLQIRPQVIHTHLFYANLIGLTAGWLRGSLRESIRGIMRWFTMTNIQKD